MMKGASELSERAGFSSGFAEGPLTLPVFLTINHLFLWPY